ncbi:MAG TPA: serine/threonine protein phosphatase [Ruminococcaceae bacterium]|nr:serine/threonine protein phosphatase [Oscillospiraceae bacterium]
MMTFLRLRRQGARAKRKEEGEILLSDLFKKGERVMSVQTADRQTHPFNSINSYVPLTGGHTALYDSICESVPIVAAAVDKIIRLTGGFSVECETAQAQKSLDSFIENVNVGAASAGLARFLDCYLKSLLIYGNAVGEIVLDKNMQSIAGLYNSPLENITVRQGKTPLDLTFYTGGLINAVPVKYPQLILFSALNPKAGSFLGTPLLSGLEFVTSVLLKIFNSTAVNFDRLANLRFAVTYKPNGSTLDRAYAKDIAANIAKEWADSMSSTKYGAIKDFVAVGDVDIKVIGADNQMLDTEAPVRQMLEQIIARLGVPPFLLGLNWSTTERMSKQQADILTSELESYRSLLTPVISRICSLYLRLNGFADDIKVNWRSINLQDEIELAKARLYSAQADKLQGKEADK